MLFADWQKMITKYRMQLTISSSVWELQNYN